ncbi:unnamed protein product [[Candida] boidinii]|uniref:Unnamed protein product n=1 Tax=Candida boidinii TaxID=5477 RepID=A0ACB5U2P3_CANBO|nr:unnamed protein product [[Candida] boidinii]
MKGEKPASSLSDKNTQRRPQPSSKPQTSHTGTQSGSTTSTHINDGSRPTSTTSRRPLPPSSSQRVEVDPAVARLKQARKEENERRLEMMKAQEDRRQTQEIFPETLKKHKKIQFIDKEVLEVVQHLDFK